MRYVTARLNEQSRDQTYRFYVTDLLRGNAPIPRYAEIAYPEVFEHDDDPEEIKRNIIKKLEG